MDRGQHQIDGGAQDITAQCRPMQMQSAAQAKMTGHKAIDQRRTRPDLLRHLRPHRIAPSG